MANHVYDIVAQCGQYKCPKTGQMKTRYRTIGKVFHDTQNDTRSIKIDSIPTGQWDGWCSLFKPDRGQNGQNQPQQNAQNQQQQARPAQAAPQPAADYEDDSIPF